MDHQQLIYRFQMVIFHSYVNTLEGTHISGPRIEGDPGVSAALADSVVLERTPMDRWTTIGHRIVFLLYKQQTWLNSVFSY